MVEVWQFRKQTEGKGKGKMEELISVIVPVYGAEKYLKVCVDSIRQQTYQNLEIILVDDASPDGSGAMCDGFAKEDSRITVIHREKNGGISAARNSGLAIAKGAYIGFADCDDDMHPRNFEILAKLLEEHQVDIVVADYEEIEDADMDHEDAEIVYDKIQVTGYTGVECMNHLLTVNNVKTILPWNKLYKRKVFDAGHRFPEGINGEDDFCIPHLLCEAEKVIYTDVSLYYWRKRPSSYSRSFKLSRTSYLYVLEEREAFLKDKISDELKHRFLVHYMEILWDFYYLVKHHYPEEKERIRGYRCKFQKKYEENKAIWQIPLKKKLKWDVFRKAIWISDIWYAIDQVKRKTIRKIKGIDNYYN